MRHCRLALRPFATLSATLALATSLAWAGNDPVSQDIPLKHRKPSEIITLLSAARNSPDRNTSSYKEVKVTPNDSKNILTARGEESEIRLLREMIKALDVAPRAIKMQVRLLRGPLNAEEGQLVEVTHCVAQATSDKPVTLTLFADGQPFYARLHARTMKDHAVTLNCQFGIAQHPQPNVEDQLAFSSTRRLIIGRDTLLTGGTKSQVTDTTASSQGIYYLEVKPVEILTPALSASADSNPTRG
jgi:hypothetical protein